MNQPKPVLSYREFLVNESVNPELAKLSSIPKGGSTSKEVKPNLSDLGVGKKGASAKSPDDNMAKIHGVASVKREWSMPKAAEKKTAAGGKNSGAKLPDGGSKPSKSVAPKFAELNTSKKAAGKTEVKPEFAKLPGAAPKREWSMPTKAEKKTV